jgi:hypothetical protein
MAVADIGEAPPANLALRVRLKVPGEMARPRGARFPQAREALNNQKENWVPSEHTYVYILPYEGTMEAPGRLF